MLTRFSIQKQHGIIREKQKICIWSSSTKR